MSKETEQEIKPSISLADNNGFTKFQIVQRLRIIDVITIAYFSIIALLVLLFNHRVSNWPLHFFWNFFAVLVLLGFCYFTYSTKSKIIWIFRDIYPFSLYTFMFKEISVLINIFFPFWLEGFLISWDKAIFGGYPTAEVQKLYHPWLTEFMAFSYWSYYILFPAGLCATFVKSKKMFREYIYNLSFTFYFCYLSYLFLTARGPQQTLVGYHLPREAAGFFDGMVLNIQAMANISGAAFPSSHVAAAGIVWLFIFKANRTFGYLVLPLTLCLIFSTVYLQYHYAVDAIAGVLVLFIIYPLAGFVKTRFANRGIYI